MAKNYTIPLDTVHFWDNEQNRVSQPWYLFLKGLVPGGSYPETTITVTSSPFSYTATDDGFVAIVGGTVSSVTLDRTAGSTGAHAVQTSGLLPVAKNDVLKVTYSSAPAMYMYPQ